MAEQPDLQSPSITPENRQVPLGELTTQPFERRAWLA
jgi:hypothetical protein